MKNVRPVLGIAGTVGVVLAMVQWGGIVRGGPLLVAGVAILLGLIGTFGLFAWWLYRSPLPPDAADRASIAPAHLATLRQVIAILALIGAVLFVIGGIWDETWHRKFGGFGSDFFWPPHIMLYTSLGVIACFAAGGLAWTLRNGGDMRASFRAEPQMGVMVLVATYLTISAPLDEVWHRLYGPDLTAWSLPHLLLIGGVTAIAIAATSIALSVRKAHWQTALATLLISFVPLYLLLIGPVEWDHVANIGGPLGMVNDPKVTQAFWNRPEWLYPVVIVTIALFIGNLAICGLRFFGCASFVGLIALSLRLLSLQLFDGWSVHIGYISYLLILPACIFLDWWYLIRWKYPDSWYTLMIGNLLAGVAILSVALPLINQVMIYPRINPSTVPGMIVGGLVMAVAAGWAGAQLGGWLNAQERLTSAQPALESSHVQLVRQ